jgi:hypothetical protein
VAEPKRMANDTELKALVKAIGDTEVLVSEIVGGFTFAELTQLVAVATDLPSIVSSASLDFPEWSALDSASQADLVAYVQANCKYPSNMNIEVWVQKVLNAIILLSSIYETIAA